MNKHFLRLITLVLVPFLSADPAATSALTPAPYISRLPRNFATPVLFEQEALAAEPLPSPVHPILHTRRHFLKRITAIAGGTAVVAAGAHFVSPSVLANLTATPQSDNEIRQLVIKGLEGVSKILESSTASLNLPEGYRAVLVNLRKSLVTGNDEAVFTIYEDEQNEVPIHVDQRGRLGVNRSKIHLFNPDDVIDILAHEVMHLTPTQVGRSNAFIFNLATLPEVQMPGSQRLDFIAIPQSNVLSTNFLRFEALHVQNEWETMMFELKFRQAHAAFLQKDLHEYLVDLQMGTPGSYRDRFKALEHYYAKFTDAHWDPAGDIRIDILETRYKLHTDIWLTAKKIARQQSVDFDNSVHRRAWEINWLDQYRDDLSTPSDPLGLINEKNRVSSLRPGAGPLTVFAAAAVKVDMRDKIPPSEPRKISRPAMTLGRYVDTVILGEFQRPKRSLFTDTWNERPVQFDFPVRITINGQSVEVGPHWRQQWIPAGAQVSIQPILAPKAPAAIMRNTSQGQRAHELSIEFHKTKKEYDRVKAIHQRLVATAVYTRGRISDRQVRRSAYQEVQSAMAAWSTVWIELKTVLEEETPVMEQPLFGPVLDLLMQSILNETFPENENEFRKLLQRSEVLENQKNWIERHAESGEVFDFEKTAFVPYDEKQHAPLLGWAFQDVVEAMWKSLLPFNVEVKRQPPEARKAYFQSREEEQKDLANVRGGNAHALWNFTSPDFIPNPIAALIAASGFSPTSSRPKSLKEGA